MLEIRNLILVVLAAVVIAGTAIGVMRRPLARSVVLAPGALVSEPQLSESELQRAWVFSRVDFYDANRKRYQVAPEAYAAFYEMIAGEKCVRRGGALAAHFEGARVARLVLTFDPAGRFAAETSPRQAVRIEFAPNGEICRVERKGGWTYFQLPGVGHEAQRLFARGG